MIRRTRRVIVVGGLWGFAAWAGAKEIDFNTQIRPILSNNCLRCHGPDEEERKGGGDGGLRLDTYEGAKADLGEGIRALVPGDTEASELFYRVITEDEDDVMPPPKGGKRLSGEDIGLLKQWIEEGGNYAVHWAYEKPARPVLPEVKASENVKNDVDRFVLAKLEERGMEGSKQADRYTLARRVALSLTGLPPTVEEAGAFVNDAGEGAYERLVEGYLARSSYGEHWARMWLDLARYADSAGYADDPPRTIWAFRDYVIRALNENKPFDAFTIEQIAGDLLESPTEEQLVATAFHRNTLTNSEGGTDDEEFRNEAIVDRVNTTMAVWMGTTMACAQCHTHKYDPITQTEYFQMFAILNNTEDADRRREEPLLEVMSPEQKKRKQEVQARIGELEQSLKNPSEGFRRRMAAWEQKVLEGGNGGWRVLKPVEMVAESGATMTLNRDGSVVVGGKSSLTDVYQVGVAIDAETAGEELSGVKLEVMTDDSLSDWKGPGRNGNFVLNEIELELEPAGGAAAKGRYVRIDLPGNGKMIHVAEVEVFAGGENVALKGVAKQSTTGFGGDAKLAIDGNTNGNYAAKSTTHTAESKSPWWEVDLGEVKQISRIVVWNRTDNNLHTRLDGFKISVLDGERGTVWEEVSAKAPAREVALVLDGVRRLAVKSASASYEQEKFGVKLAIDGDATGHSGWAVGGKVGMSHEAVFELEVPVRVEAGARLRVVMRQSYGDHAIGRFRFSGAYGEVAEPALPLALRELLGKKERSPEDEELVSRHYAQIDAEKRKATLDIVELGSELESMKPATTVPVMRELVDNKRRKTQLQYRGSFLDKGPEVSEGVPKAFHPLPEGAGADRMGLAKWLVDKNNPLTARVIANRYWEALFGVGIVRTSEEFGAQGELPSHPELLDWLAVELMDSGWDLKHLIRLIVNSGAYRQDSRVTGEGFEQDPENRLVGRGPRFRLSAEMIRDQALSVGGLLS
ncbi:MAG: DUF1549 domain-containing protein, partial [Verrucomicrobiales bacterium]|nr:DUF1549 domain-containing protein [Verrucomicrobiales bacterium]